jgi:hypothetical protein
MHSSLFCLKITRMSCISRRREYVILQMHVTPCIYPYFTITITTIMLTVISLVASSFDVSFSSSPLSSPHPRASTAACSRRPCSCPYSHSALSQAKQRRCHCSPTLARHEPSLDSRALASTPDLPRHEPSTSDRAFPPYPSLRPLGPRGQIRPRCSRAHTRWRKM